MTSAPSLQIRPSGVSNDQLAAYSLLLQSVFGPAAKFSPEALAWRYRDNPDGAVVGFDAWDGDRLCAHYVTTPTAGVIDGAERRGLLSLNTATHPAYAGRGLFTRLAQATYQAGAAAGHGFVMGVANANSTPGFLRRLDFQFIAPLAAGLLLRLPRRFEPLGTEFHLSWSPRRLAWRLANPAASYGIARRGDLTVISAPTHLPLLRCVGFLSQGAPPPAPGPPALSLFIGLEPRLDLEALGFVRLPQRLRPSPLNLIYRRLNPTLPIVLDPVGTAISFLDFDPY